MYIAAVSYTSGDYRGGHCQAYEFKYDKQENGEKGAAKYTTYTTYTTKNCIDRSCFIESDEVINSKSAYINLKKLLSRKSYINKTIASNFGSVRLIPEQVIDEFPVQYRYYKSQEELDALKTEAENLRNKKGSIENEDIRMINEILEELKNSDKNETKNLFKDVNLLGNTPNENQGENHNNGDSLKNLSTLWNNDNFS